MSEIHKDISGKNINFLIGSGASYPVFETLSLGENMPSLEDLLSRTYEDDAYKEIISYFYYRDWIRPMKKIGASNYVSICNDIIYKNNEKIAEIKINVSPFDDVEEINLEINELERVAKVFELKINDYNSTISEYEKFIKKIIEILQNEGNERPKRVNIFTTNYDLIFENTFDKLQNENLNCYVNDGGSGFITRILNAQNFNLNISQSGYYDNYKKEIPTINLIKMHGSVSWSKIKGNDKEHQIQISYRCDQKKYDKFLIDELETLELKPQSESYSKENLTKLIAIKDGGDIDYTRFDLRLKEIFEQCDKKLLNFYDVYKNIPIINPNKWKFNETVLEQHYYQLLRSFSYELEKPNTVLIVFAFSFADEHIREIFRRSLSNPQLQVYIICYNQFEKDKLQKMFTSYKNISYYPKKFQNNDGSTISGNFTYLNSLLCGDYDEK